MSVKYDVVLPYLLTVSNTSWWNTIKFYSINNNNYTINTTKLLVKIGKRFLKKLGYWLTKNPNWNFWVYEFGYPKYVGSDTVHHFTDLKFQVPKLKSLSLDTRTINTATRKDVIMKRYLLMWSFMKRCYPSMKKHDELYKYEGSSHAL